MEALRIDIDKSTVIVVVGYHGGPIEFYLLSEQTEECVLLAVDTFAKNKHRLEHLLFDYGTSRLHFFTEDGELFIARLQLKVPKGGKGQPPSFA